jgi:hypothetical protein
MPTFRHITTSAHRDILRQARWIHLTRLDDMIALRRMRPSVAVQGTLLYQQRRPNQACLGPEINEYDKTYIIGALLLPASVWPEGLTAKAWVVTTNIGFLEI